MHARHRDIIDSDLTLVSSTHVKDFIIISKGKHMNGTAWVFLKWQRLHHKIVWRSLGNFYVNQLVHFLISFKCVRIGILAKFTLEVSPKESHYWLWLFSLHLHWDPILQACIVDEANCARAITWHDARILLCAFSTPAESALWLVFVFVTLRWTWVCWQNFISFFIHIRFDKGHLVSFG